LFPQKILPENYDFIGPLFYEGTNPESEIISQLDKNKRTILVTLGSSGDWRAVGFLNKVMFSDFNIITAGDEQEILNAPHIICKRFLNNIALLPYCDLIICHGGNGTVCQALAYDIPIVALTNIFEQEWNMQQVKTLGYGDVINETRNETELMKELSRWIGIKKKYPFAVEYQAFKKNRAKTFMRVWQLLNKKE
jgi:UDP:flavonoid glycosyltransferase YjiC (YdhE family)